MKAKTLILTLTAATSLAFADVKTDYDHKANFERYHTYSWITAGGTNDLWSDRIMQAVDEQLAAKGWQKVASGGDATVSAFGRVRNDQTLETYYTGLGAGWYWRGWGGDKVTTVQNTPVGSLTVDIFDAGTKHLIWRGMSTETLSEKPEKNERKLEKSAEEMFHHFPPSH